MCSYLFWFSSVDNAMSVDTKLHQPAWLCWYKCSIVSFPQAMTKSHGKYETETSSVTIGRKWQGIAFFCQQLANQLLCHLSKCIDQIHWLNMVTKIIFYANFLHYSLMFVMSLSWEMIQGLVFDGLVFISLLGGFKWYIIIYVWEDWNIFEL